MAFQENLTEMRGIAVNDCECRGLSSMVMRSGEDGVCR